MLSADRATVIESVEVGDDGGEEVIVVGCPSPTVDQAEVWTLRSEGTGL